MRYRRLGQNGPEVSVLGFGCMRLPVVQGTGHPMEAFDPNRPIDEERALQMVDFAIDHGVNYFDTAYMYHGGKSEEFLGKALAGRRERVYIATKLPPWLLEKPEDCDRLLDEQLKRLQTSFVDVYLLHGLNRPHWRRVHDLGLLSFLDRVLADGRARYVGFSFHDDIKIFKEIIDAHPWTVCQIQYNYFDQSYQAGKEGLIYAASKGIGVVVMEPIRGGRLAGQIPAEVQAVWNTAPTPRTPAEWALRWVWNHPEVSTALSGMNTLEQVEENVRLADQAIPHSLSPEELDLVARVTQIYRKKLKVDCTGCAYCMPCPNGVNIPVNFSLYNDTFLFQDTEVASRTYQSFLLPEQRASNCAECGECLEHCPQQIDIPERLKDVDRRLSSRGSQSDAGAPTAS